MTAMTPAQRQARRAAKTRPVGRIESPESIAALDLLRKRYGSIRAAVEAALIALAERSSHGSSAILASKSARNSSGEGRQ